MNFACGSIMMFIEIKRAMPVVLGSGGCGIGIVKEAMQTRTLELDMHMSKVRNWASLASASNVSDLVLSPC